MENGHPMTPLRIFFFYAFIAIGQYLDRLVWGGVGGGGYGIESYSANIASNWDSF